MPWACGSDERNRPHPACCSGTSAGPGFNSGHGFNSGCDACPSPGAHTGVHTGAHTGG